MSIKTGLVALAFLAIAAPSPAKAEPTPSILKFPAGQAGLSAALAYDADNDRLSGARATLFADFLGFGFAISVDYQNLLERLEGTTFGRHSGTVGLAFRFSPISLMTARRNPEALSWFDLFATAGVEGGICSRALGVSARDSAWLGIGIELRPGFTRRGLPGIRVEYQHHSNRSPDFAIADMVMVGLSLSGAGRPEE